MWCCLDASCSALSLLFNYLSLLLDISSLLRSISLTFCLCSRHFCVVHMGCPLLSSFFYSFIEISLSLFRYIFPSSLFLSFSHSASALGICLWCWLDASCSAQPALDMPTRKRYVAAYSRVIQYYTMSQTSCPFVFCMSWRSCPYIY